MRHLIGWILLGGLALAPAVNAQTGAQTAPAPSPYDKAPWWMRESVIAQTGYVYTEVRANRARFSATYLAVDSDLGRAQSAATERTRALQQALARLGEDKVAVSVDFSQRALFEQYKDKNGNRIEDQRGDKINGYEVSITVNVEVRDISRLEIAYALAMAASPTSIDEVRYELQVGDDDTAWLYAQAVKDASERVTAETAAAGAVLGKVQTVDPQGRACRGDVLARNPGSGGGITAQPVAWYKGDALSAATPPAPATPGTAEVVALEARARQASYVQTPPLRHIEARTCVVYGLN